MIFRDLFTCTLFKLYDQMPPCQLPHLKKNKKQLVLSNIMFIIFCITDESPETCGVFLREGGLDLFLLVLEAFPGKATVETKVRFELRFI